VFKFHSLTIKSTVDLPRTDPTDTSMTHSVSSVLCLFRQVSVRLGYRPVSNLSLMSVMSLQASISTPRLLPSLQPISHVSAGQVSIRLGYRPVSNLSLISKLIECVVKSRLTEHLPSNNLLNPHQSAYRKHHSSETALYS